MNYPQQISVDRDETVNLAFQVVQNKAEPDYSDKGVLKLTLTPTDENISGAAPEYSLSSNLMMNRLFSNEPFVLIPGTSSGNIVEKRIPWSHIPEGDTVSADYQIEFCIQFVHSISLVN